MIPERTRASKMSTPQENESHCAGLRDTEQIRDRRVGTRGEGGLRRGTRELFGGTRYPPVGMRGGGFCGSVSVCLRFPRAHAEA